MSASTVPAVVEAHALDVPSPSIAVTPDAETEVDPVVAVQLAAHHAEHRTETAHERAPEALRAP